MGTLRANGVWSPAAADPVEIHVEVNVVAASASDAIGGLGRGVRQPRMFSAATQTEKAGIEGLMPGGLIEGDEVFMVDTSWYEMFIAGAWKITKTLVSIPWSPAWGGSTNITPGNGVNNFRYWIDGDEITVQGVFDFGTTGAIGVATRTEIEFPIPPRFGGSEVGVLGVAIALDGSSPWHGAVVGLEGTLGRLAASIILESTSNAGGLRQNMQAGIPTGTFWNTGVVGRMISVLFTYTRA